MTAPICCRCGDTALVTWPRPLCAWCANHEDALPEATDELAYLLAEGRPAPGAYGEQAAQALADDLTTENERLRAENARLRVEVEGLREVGDQSGLWNWSNAVIREARLFRASSWGANTWRHAAIKCAEKAQVILAALHAEEGSS